MDRVHRIAWALLVATLVVPGCAGTAERSPARTSATAWIVEPDPPLGTGEVLQTIDADALARRLASPTARATLVNVWATWCVPCREEFPDLLALRRTYRPQGLELKLISTDFPDQRADAETFLREQGVAFPTWIKEGPDEPFIDTLSASWSGSLPATFLYDADGVQRRAWPGVIDPKEVAAAIETLLGTEKPE